MTGRAVGGAVATPSVGLVVSANRVVRTHFQAIKRTCQNSREPCPGTNKSTQGALRARRRCIDQHFTPFRDIAAARVGERVNPLL